MELKKIEYKEDNLPYILKPTKIEDQDKKKKKKKITIQKQATMELNKRDWKIEELKFKGNDSGEVKSIYMRKILKKLGVHKCVCVCIYIYVYL